MILLRRLLLHRCYFLRDSAAEVRGCLERVDLEVHLELVVRRQLELLGHRTSCLLLVPIYRLFARLSLTWRRARCCSRALPVSCQLRDPVSI